MRNLFKPASFGLYVLLLLNFFILGMYVAGVLGVAKNQGLAGGAIVFGWGVIFAGIAFIGGLILVNYISTKRVVKINIILLIVLLLAVGTLYLINSNRVDNQQPDESKEIQKKTKTPTAVPLSIHLNFFKEFLKRKEFVDISDETTNDEMGLGFFVPNFYEFPVLYFYGGVNLDKAIHEHAPQDSVVFIQREGYQLSTSYAPPWLYPEHLKLDYELMAFKVLGLGHDFIKVEVNKTTGQIAYLDKFKGTYKTWPEFLRTVSSLELIDKESQTVHIKPLHHAAKVQVAFKWMQPILIENNWMYVKLLDENHKEKGKGWIQWKECGKLLVTYNLLS
tara:strand:+ start:7232 stop:8233 length:1002 start_codon:yes stop_codon:yes gene_type:complete